MKEGRKRLAISTGMQEGYIGSTHTCLTTRLLEKRVKAMEREKGGRLKEKGREKEGKKKTRREKQISGTCSSF